MVNIEFLGVTYIVSKSVDWILQWQPHANIKSKNYKLLTEHSLIYSMWTTIILQFIFHYDIYSIFFILWVLFSTHYIIDTRIPVKYIMHLKGIAYDEMDNKYGWMQIELDQILHSLVILLLAMVI